MCFSHLNVPTGSASTFTRMSAEELILEISVGKHWEFIQPDQVVSDAERIAPHVLLTLEGSRMPIRTRYQESVVDS